MLRQVVALNTSGSAEGDLYLLFINTNYFTNYFMLCQVVALNSSGSAEGDLYVDDGSSFAFERGAYAHRHFRHVCIQNESSHEHGVVSAIEQAS